MLEVEMLDYDDYEYQWAEILRYKDKPGIQYLADTWGEDQLRLARLVIYRQFVRRALRMVGLAVTLSAFIIVHFVIELPFNHIATFGIVLAMVVWWFLVSAYTERGLDEAAKYDSFARAVHKFCEAFDLTIEQVAEMDRDKLASFVNSKMVVTALDVRKLERDSAGIPQEHWERQKRKFTSTLERCYDAAGRFKLAGGGYGPYYRQADQQLATA